MTQANTKDAKEAIAIVGMGCRLPGDINSPSKLWDFLSQSKSAQGKIPPERFNAEGFYNPDSNISGSMSADGGYFIKEDIRNFEPDFFGINNMEATYMDPQQRKLLEVVYECLESGGVSLQAASGANIGTYVGTFTMDFQLMQATDPHHFHRYSATGMGTTILANRISHTFNLTGPSFVLDTACSSSLYALHTACRALQSGDCDAAIVAGANLIQSPHQFIGTEKAGVLSKTSTCHTFDTSADGYGRADGVGALYVKRLSDALRDGDPIRSVIRATAVNSNGRTNGITQPSADGQEAVIRKAYAMTDLDPSITDYIETHGTGTSLGDATEVDGVARVFSQNREKPLLIGSVKTNLGHSEAASGISSIIKVTMAMEKGVIPPTVGVTNINPKLKLDERNCEIVRKMTPWPTTGRARIASINSFGYGGANAHMILEEAASYITPKVAVVEKEQKNTVILPLSANTPQSLDSLAQGLADINPDVDPISLASTLFNQRSRLSKRGYVVAKTTDFSESVREAPLKTLPSTSKLPLAFVFTGQGAQWSGMGRSLLTEYPSFRQSIRRLDAVLQSLPLTERPDWLLEDVLGPDANEDEIHNPSRSQPICTAVQVAIIRLLADWNIKPSAVIGHSSGEIASAYCTGHLTAEQAIIVAYYRGFVAAQTPNDGMMLAGGMNEEQATDFINDNGAQGKVRVACVNSPENVTLSGDADAIDELAALLTKQGIMARKLKTHGKAYHSHHMARVGPKYEELLQSLASSVQFNGTSNVRMVSTVTGKEAVSQLPLTYWRQNLEQPVLFNDGIEKLFAKENYHLVEIGPHSALALPLKQILSKVKGAKYNYDSALIRGKDAAETLLQLAGNLYLHGHNVNIDRANGISSLKRESAVVDLAPYPWHYDTVLWNEPRASIEFRNQKHPRHELLGSKVPGGNGVVHTWRNIIRLKEVGWLAGHKLDQSTVFPAAGYLATAIEAIRQVTDSSLDKRPSFVLKDVRIEKALALLDENPESGVELMTTLQPHRSGSGPTTSWEFNMTSFAAGIPLQHAFGSIAVDATDRNCNRKLIADADVRMEEKPAAPWYAKFAEGGLVFGDQFQSLTDIHVPTNKAILQAGAKTALIQGGLRANSQEPLYAVHPATIDAMLQAGIIANTGGIVKDLSAKVPVNIAEIHIQTPVAGINATGKISATSEKLPFGAINVAADLFADDGSLLAQVRGCRAAAYRSVSANVEDYTRHPMLRVQWKPDFTEIRSKHSSAVSRYLIPAAKGEEQSCGADKLMSLLGLALHQNPKARILELGQDSEEITKSLVNDLATDEIFAPCAFFSQGQVSDDGKLSFRNVSADPESYNAEFQESTEDDLFDIVLLSGAELDVSAIMEQLSPAGQLMGKFSTSQLEELSKLGFEQVLAESREAGDFVVLKQIQDGVEGLATAEHIVIVENSEASESESFFAESLASKLRDISKADIQKIALKDLSAAQIPEKAAVISTLEFERTLLAVMSEEEMNGVRILTETASSFIWLTSGSLLKAPTPEFGLAAGIARSVMLERPSLKFITYDIDTLNYNTNDTIENIFSVLAKAVSGTLRDFEFLESDGLAHISRFVPDAPLNKVFRERQNMQLAEAPIGELGYAQVPMTDLIRGGEVFFRQEDDSVKLPEDWVKVDIKALELDTSVIDQGTTFGFTGVIVETGSKVGSFLPGDYVFALAPSKIATSVSVPQACCYRVKKSDNLSMVAATMPTFAAATYALHYQARYRTGESVLVTDVTGKLGQAALQIAQRAGADVYVIADLNEEAGTLARKYKLPASHVLTVTSGASNGYSLLRATNEKGFNIILHTRNEMVPEDLLKTCAKYGCFVDLSLTAQADGKALSYLPRGAVWSTADLRGLYDTEEAHSMATLQQVMNDVFQKHRTESLSALEPVQVFDVSEIKHAFDTVASHTTKGVIALSLQDANSKVKFQPLSFKTTFHSHKTYVMIGCLGGLGRSTSKWMVERGARKFLFLGRSGTKNPAAAKLVNDLEAMGCDVIVARGDVGKYEDVEGAMSMIEGPIGGVVHAAMGLHESLFAAMSAENWHTAIGPKRNGAWNLHNALQALQKEDELDFFLLTSSVSGSVGTATEANYCAANHFLDNFAWYRRSLGLPATAVGLGMISEVGYLHENPEIQELLIRKGIQAIPESEMLQMLDCALGDDKMIEGQGKQHGAAHILTGLEPTAVLELRKRGFDGSMSTLNEPRMSLLARAFEAMDPASSGSGSSMENIQTKLEKLAKAGEPIFEEIIEVISKKFSNAFLIPVEKLDVNKALTNFGMDSMLAAEIRTWFYQTLGFDIAFFVLLSPETSITALSQTVEKDIQKRFTK